MPAAAVRLALRPAVAGRTPDRALADRALLLTRSLLLAGAPAGTELPVRASTTWTEPGAERWSDGGAIPYGDAAAAAMAPALVNASAMAATAAVRLPLHRGLLGGGATAGASERIRGVLRHGVLDLRARRLRDGHGRRRTAAR